MNKLIHVSILILAANICSFSVAQATLKDLAPAARTEEKSLKLLGITSDQERSQFVADMEAYTKADYALERMTNPQYNTKIKNIGKVISQMKISFQGLMEYSAKVLGFRLAVGSYRDYPELQNFFKQVNAAVGKGIKAGPNAGDEEINEITNDADFVSKLNEYAATLKELENGKFGIVIKNLQNLDASKK